MAISLTCACGKTLRAKDELAGKRVKCPSCGKAVAIPSAGAPAGPTPPAAKPRPETPPPRPPDEDDEGVAEGGPAHAGGSGKGPPLMLMIALLGVLFLSFAISTILALVVLGGVAAVAAGAVAVVSIVACCVLGFRIQKRIVRMYPVRARAMLDAHLEPADGDLIWVYGMTTPGALTNLLLPFSDLSRSFLLGLTRRRLLVLRTTEQVSQELAARSIPFADIATAWVEECADPHGLGPLAAKKGLLLHFELRDGSKFEVGSAYEFPSFPAHRANLERIATFLPRQEYRDRD
jgi:hypothetical protein